MISKQNFMNAWTNLRFMRDINDLFATVREQLEQISELEEQIDEKEEENEE